MRVHAGIPGLVNRALDLKGKYSVLKSGWSDGAGEAVEQANVWGHRNS